MMNIAAPISEMRMNAIPGDLKKKKWKQIWPLTKLSYNNRPRFRKVRQLLIEIGTSFYHSCFSSKLMTHKKAQPQSSFSTICVSLWGEGTWRSMLLGLNTGGFDVARNSKDAICLICLCGFIWFIYHYGINAD